jgi:hypothetical protein
MIYLIKSEKTNTCKIGYASNPENRLAQLQTGNPFALELVAVIEGDIPEEKRIHQMFKSYRLKGEWFEYSVEIKEYFKVEEHYLIYESMIEIMKNSNDVKLKLYAGLIEKYSQSQSFTMTKDLKHEIANQTGCKSRSLDTAFTDLVRKNVVVKIAPQLYKVNPRHVFKGSTSNRNEALKAVIELGCREC